MLDKKNFIIIITSLLIKLITSLNHTDFCYSLDKECVGRYSAKNVYQTECIIKCPKNYAYKCDDEFCTVDKDKCIKYKKRSNSLFGYFHINFRANVKKCHIDSFRLKPNVFCLYNNMTENKTNSSNFVVDIEIKKEKRNIASFIKNLK